MKSLTTKEFINKDLNLSLTTFLDDKQTIWFKGKDVAFTLGYKDTDQTIRKNVEKEDKKSYPVFQTGQVRKVVFINESGLYSHIFNSKLEQAKMFKRWVTSKILPCIRKYGIYQQFNTKNSKVFMIQDEFSLHKRVVYFLRNYCKDALFSVGLGELQDTVSKRVNSKKKGYTKGESDITINNFHKKYNGFCIELKTPKETGILLKEQQDRLKHYEDNNYLTLVSDNYEEIILAINEYFRDVRLPCTHCRKKFKSDESRNKHYKFFHKISK